MSDASLHCITIWIQLYASDCRHSALRKRTAIISCFLFVLECEYSYSFTSPCLFDSWEGVVCVVHHSSIMMLSVAVRHSNYDLCSLKVTFIRLMIEDRCTVLSQMCRRENVCNIISLKKRARVTNTIIDWINGDDENNRNIHDFIQMSEQSQCRLKSYESSDDDVNMNIVIDRFCQLLFSVA